MYLGSADLEYTACTRGQETAAGAAAHNQIRQHDRIIRIYSDCAASVALAVPVDLTSMPRFSKVAWTP